MKPPLPLFLSALSLFHALFFLLSTLSAYPFPGVSFSRHLFSSCCLPVAESELGGSRGDVSSPPSDAGGIPVLLSILFSVLEKKKGGWGRTWCPNLLLRSPVTLEDVSEPPLSISLPYPHLQDSLRIRDFKRPMKGTGAIALDSLCKGLIDVYMNISMGWLMPKGVQDIHWCRLKILELLFMLIFKCILILKSCPSLTSISMYMLQCIPYIIEFYVYHLCIYGYWRY